MSVWIDAQISPMIAQWLRTELQIDAVAIRDVGLRDAEDAAIFFEARGAKAVVMTKDADFVLLLSQHGPPPCVIWIRSGNTSNAHLRSLLKETAQEALRLIDQGEELVTIGDVRA